MVLLLLVLRLQLLLLLMWVAASAAANANVVVLGMMVVEAVAATTTASYGQLQLRGAGRGGQKCAHCIWVAAAVRNARVRRRVATNRGRHGIAIDASPGLIQFSAGEGHEAVETRADSMLPVGLIISGNNIVCEELG